MKPIDRACILRAAGARVIRLLRNDRLCSEQLLDNRSMQCWAKVNIAWPAKPNLAKLAGKLIRRLIDSVLVVLDCNNGWLICGRLANRFCPRLYWQREQIISRTHKCGANTNGYVQQPNLGRENRLKIAFSISSAFLDKQVSFAPNKLPGVQYL